VRLLLAHGADTGARDAEGGRPLHYAALSDSREGVDTLVAAGADVHAANLYGDTPFSYAAWQEKRVAFDALLAHAYPRVRARGAALLFGVCQSLEAADCAQALRGDPGEPVPTLLLLFAAQLGKVDALREALASGADVRYVNDATGQPPLHAAAASGCTACARALLQAGADAAARDADGRTPLSLATGNGHADVARLLRTTHAARPPPPGAAGIDDDDEDDDDDGDEAGLRAFSRDELNDALRKQAHADAATAARLLAAGADVHALDADGFTALHWAAFNGGEGYARQLLRAGAAVNGAASGDMSPLMCAAKGGHAPLLRLLLAHGADVGARSRQEARGALHYAADAGARDAVKVLLSAGADAHAVDAAGDTPFSLAVQQERRVFDALVAHAFPAVRARGAALLYDACNRMPVRQCVEVVEADPVGTPVPALLLHLAAGTGDTGTCEELLASGADARYATRVSRRTPLHAAAEHGHAGCAAALLGAGADDFASDAQDDTPYALALQGGHADVFTLMVQRSVPQVLAMPTSPMLLRRCMASGNGSSSDAWACTSLLQRVTRVRYIAAVRSAVMPWVCLFVVGSAIA
jgi:cytohesin